MRGDVENVEADAHVLAPERRLQFGLCPFWFNLRVGDRMASSAARGAAGIEASTSEPDSGTPVLAKTSRSGSTEVKSGNLPKTFS